MKYRKKPVVVEAVQWDGHNVCEILSFCPDADFLKLNDVSIRLTIPTLEGPHRAEKGDYIIRGVKGEFYPCKPDIFALTYEAAEDGPEDDYPGLKVKYHVYKARNNELVENCFVLRPDKDPAAVEALRAYASATENGQLAKDIIAWVGQPQPLTLDELGEAWQKGVPVYAKGVDGEAITRRPGVWCVLDGREVAGIGFQLIAIFGHNLTLAQSDYGKTWLAYAQRPEEEKNGEG